MINQYQWENYLKSGGGKTVKVFEELLDFDKFYNNSKEIIDYICELYKSFSLSKDTYAGLKEELNMFFEYDYSYLEDRTSYCIKSALNDVLKGIEKEFGITKDSEKLKVFAGAIECHTISLSMGLPGLFVPWFYLRTFNVFESICDYFEIELPDIPAKADCLGRINYYGYICAVLYEFREENGMTPAQLCAFLYDYAPKTVLEQNLFIKEVFDEPRSAYFIGGNASDGDLKNVTNDTVYSWQANPDTQVGDAIVMYLKSPDSKIDSIWRAVTPGFIDPFFWYYRCTYIGDPIRINGMTLKQMKEDPVVGEMTIVKKNLQGINGVLIKPSIYNYMLDCAEPNIMERNQLPYIKYAADIKTDKELQNEHDVEIVFLEPLLEKLGYKKEHWCRQMSAKIGRNERIIPDYVIYPVYTPGKERGEIVLEAKFSIDNAKQLESDRRQVASYAKQLLSTYCLLVSKEGVWVYSHEDTFESCILNCTWSELGEDKDIFNRLYHIVGF